MSATDGMPIPPTEGGWHVDVDDMWPLPLPTQIDGRDVIATMEGQPLTFPPEMELDELPVYYCVTRVQIDQGARVGQCVWHVWRVSADPGQDPGNEYGTTHYTHRGSYAAALLAAADAAIQPWSNMHPLGGAR